MKEKFLILGSLLLMTGCTQNELDLQYESTSDHVQTELYSKSKSLKDEVSFEANGQVVEVVKDHEVLQTLECDWVANNNSIIIDDFDFDGYDDLFVRMEYGAMYAPGTYFRYHPETSKYEKWDALNTIGKEMLADHEKQTLMYRKYDSAYWSEYFTYEWNEGSLVLIEHMISEDGAVFETLPID